MQRLVDRPQRWDALAWNALGAEMPFFPLEQAWAYGEAMAELGQSVSRIRVSAGGGTASAQLFARRVFGLWNVVQSVRGPAFAGDSAAIPELLRELLTACPRGFPRVRLLMPELGADMHRAVTAAGLRRVLTGYHTQLLDLRQGTAALRAGMEGRWRNRLVAAESEKLRLDIAKGGRLLDWLVERNTVLGRQRGIALPKPGLVRALVQAAGPPQTLIVAVLAKNQPLCAGLFLRHGPDATYYVSHTTEAGRQLSATNLMLWTAIARLADAGVRQLDLGGIDTRAAPGLARFKLGLGGRTLSLTGTYAR
ncbi:GNAT family N-acetyltransferase [Desertibaculum subflavum]|uniref:GNAT family N-acetyltransferase n=1 Tax=Desertibaculum subflavum TaxID=2268458 RepID=UPI000E675961